MPYPDGFDSRAYAAAYERPIVAIEPPLYAATPADIDAMQKARAWLVVALTSLRQHPWEFDSTEIPPHHFLVADADLPFGEPLHGVGETIDARFQMRSRSNWTVLHIFLADRHGA